MKFWQMLHWVESDQLLALARFAEELGFEGVMNGDHAIYPEVVDTPYPYAADGKPPMSSDWPYPDCWVSIAMMAAVTSRLKFSTSVYVLPLRNPIEVAKAAGTLAVMSDNRFVLGAGIGWMKEEYDCYGVDFHTRGRRMDDCLAVMRKLWSGEMVEHHSEFFDFERCRVLPAPTQQVPVFTGGASPAALRRAARSGDGWIGAGNDPDEVPEVLAELTRLRREAGREQQPFETVVGLTRGLDADTLKRLRDAGMTAAVSPPFAYSLGRESSLDDKKRVMEQFAETVMRHLL